ncbi:tRNA (N(6)-L-threonylcarbamoyladenosine(37)-C(2))-methylthiotransferase MtaB [Sulfurimonas sp. HSL1-6]|uniref:tRNA (N(6)-L-threonylcarbamoyladenosine(37)-C(2))- methylthiotransferase MtaB n=1 Tax=Thiomicrolovo immobilis TaxID=3131935 RepID=UPI0031FA41D4
MKPKVYFKTFGCRTNVFDTQVMMGRLQDFEVTEDESAADIVVVNSCTVTNGADTGVRGYINAQERAGRTVMLTGCGAHTKGETLFDAGKVQGVFGQSEKAKINELLQRKTRFYELGDLEFIDDNVVEQFVGKSRAFIKIQEGCSFRCSYCIIPFVRGDARSVDEQVILEQVSRLAANGFGEFILTGTNIGSYGQGENRSIATLLQKMSLIRGVRRIRLGSLEPVQITDAFKEILDEPWLERHLHIALQHTSKEMLKLMNRRNKFDEDLKLFSELSAKGFALGTDFIVGHPGETEARWEEAWKHLQQLPLTHVHAFTYSKRDGTPSATMKPEISGAVAKERLAQLTALVDANNFAFRREHCTDLDVLVESVTDDGRYQGYDQYYNKILIDSEADLEGNWIRIESATAAEEYNHAVV